MIEPLHHRTPIKVTIFVLALHGLAVWAGISIESPKRPLLPVESAQAIQIELLKSATSATQKSAISDQSESKTEPVPQPQLQPQNVIIEPVDTQRVIASSKPAVNKVAVDAADMSAQAADNSEKADGKNIEKDRQNDDFTEDTDDDLSAMIRSVRAQFNRDQALQRQALSAQKNRQRAEQVKLQVQADTDALNKLLSLAAEQAELQKAQVDQLETEKAKNALINQNMDDDELAIRFLEDDAIWLAEHQPVTDIPLIVWRSAKARAGDLFIVLLELNVDVEGNVTQVRLVESSGNMIIDAVATTQVRTGQLKPLMVDNVAVAAIVPMSLVYETP